MRRGGGPRNGCAGSRCATRSPGCRTGACCASCWRGSWPRRAARARAWRCCWSTSTTSSRSTTRWATRPATSCCSRWRAACGWACARATTSPASAATSSRSWRSAPRRRTRSARWPAAASRARRLVAAFATPFAVAGAEARTGASIGVAIWPDDGENAEALLGRADLALYAAKEAGRGTWRFFRPAMQARAEALVAFARDLHKALERGELALHHQPVVDLADLRPRAFEALLRWQHPERGLVPPSALLPAA